MKYALIFAASIFAQVSFAQEKKDIGITAGASYYLGDYNSTFHFKQTRPLLGVVFRHNTSSYYSLRGSAGLAAIAGSHNPTSFYLPGNTSSFGSQVFVFDGVTEINFLPFDTSQGNKKNHTPYVVLGAGLTIANGAPLLHIPLGIGYKYAFGNRISISAEWTLKKTFTDSMDGFINPNNGYTSLVHNNDWISVAGLNLMYRLYSKKALCPVYQ